MTCLHRTCIIVHENYFVLETKSLKQSKKVIKITITGRISEQEEKLGCKTTLYHMIGHLNETLISNEDLIPEISKIKYVRFFFPTLFHEIPKRRHCIGTNI